MLFIHVSPYDIVQATKCNFLCCCSLSHLLSIDFFKSMQLQKKKKKRERERERERESEQCMVDQLEIHFAVCSQSKDVGFFQLISKWEF